MTLPAHKIEDHSQEFPYCEDCGLNHPPYEEMMLKTYQWLCMKPRIIGHVSDLLMCLRQRVFQELNPLPPDKHRMNLYSSGKSIHETIQSLIASDRGRFEKEHLVFYKGLSGAVDVYDKRYNIPMEYKTPRKDGPLTEAADYNLEQLKTYMAILDSQYGYLQYQFIIGKKIDYQHFFITMTKQERKDQLELMLSKLSNLEVGVEAGQPVLTDGVYDNPALKWLCKDCPYREPCEQMR